jgi:CRISPR-associated protein Csb2
MAITLKLKFPAGRYHATPWGRHVNEGIPEWPPSPWRLLRAIVAVWKRTCQDLSEQQVRRLLEPLLSPPLFCLPPHRVAHTRHYMPLGKKSPVEIRGGGTTLVFDTFVAVARKAELFVGWPNAELSGEDRAAFARLVANLTWLGRAEAWVLAELTDEAIAWSCVPAGDDEANPVPVFCPDPASALGGDHYPTHDAKVIKRGIKLKERLFACPRWHLCLDTATIRNERWPRVPGARWVNYVRPLEAAITMKPSRVTGPMPTIARYSLDGPVLPLVQASLPLAEAARRALMSRYRKLKEIELYGRTDPPNAERFVSAVFSGKDAQGVPLRDDHCHAFFLPTDEDGDGRLDHLTVFAHGGFPRDEVKALDALRWLRCGDLDLALLLVGLGQEAEYRHTRILGLSNVWTSATPFLVTRHMKRRGQKRDPREFFETPHGRVEFVKQVLREELERRGLYQEGVEIEPVESVGTQHRLRPIEFVLRRPNKPGDDGPSRPRGLFRLRFPKPISGPIALGHSCHFGLGLFVNENDA